MNQQSGSDRVSAVAGQTLISIDTLVGVFVQRFRQGAAPDIAHFLTTADATQRATLLVALVQAEIAERMRGEPSLRLESYLHRYPALGDPPTAPVELIVAEFNARRAAGQHPAISEYESRFPHQFNTVRAELGLLLETKDEPPERDLLELDPGSQWADFQIVREIGRGRVACVYLARQLSLDRLVALKVSRSESGVVPDEARTLAQLEHDHIVPVYSEHVVGPRRLLAMRYSPGVPLTTLLDRLAARRRNQYRGRDLVNCIDSVVEGDGQPADEVNRPDLSSLSFVRAVCTVILGLARGLAHAHRHGVLHRDINPDNILITRSGRAMLMDFNVAARRETPSLAPGHANPNGSSAAGRGHSPGGSPVIGGTPAYMAPEHLAALTPVRAITATVDERSDIYSLGIVFYELLSGQRPFNLPDSGGDPLTAPVRLMAGRLRRPDPIPRHLIRITPGLDSILEKCLAPEPADRYQSASDLCSDLERYLTDRPLVHAAEPSWFEAAGKWQRRHPRWTPAAWTAVLLALLAMIGILWHDYKQLKEIESLVAQSYRQFSADDWTGAFEYKRRAEEALDRAGWLLPRIGLQKHHRIVTVQVRMLGRLPAEQLRSFAFYSSLARGGLDMPKRAQARAGQSTPARQALWAYQVLERPDWQQLPTFQLLNAEEQSDIEAFITEMILIESIDTLLANGQGNREAEAVTKLLDRIPASYRDRRAVQEVARLAREGNIHAAALPSVIEHGDLFDVYLMGVLAAKLGRFDTAIAYFDRVLQQISDDQLLLRYWSHLHRAWCAEQRGDQDAAIADYAICIGLDNQYVPHHNLGLIYARQGKYALAARSLRQAVRLGGRHVAIYVNLAAVELKLGNYPDALDAANEAITMDANMAEAYAKRGAIFAAMGQRDAALNDLKRAIAIDPNCSAARQNLELLETAPAPAPAGPIEPQPEP